MNLRHPILLWLPVALYMAGIFHESSLSVVPGTGGISDVILHTVGYAGLAMITLRATAGGRWSGVTLEAVVIAWLAATAYGVTDEYHQAFTPGRSPELRDVINDAIGAVVAVSVLGAWGMIKRTPRTRS